MDRATLRWGGCVLVVAALAVGCGDVVAPPQQSSTVRGVAWMSGPLAGAVVTAYEVDDLGERVGVPLGVGAPTGADGVFEVVVGVSSGSVLLEFDGAGASWQELATGATAQGAAGAVLVVVVRSLSVDELRDGVVASPITTMAAAHARARVAAGNEATYALAVERSEVLLGTHFGGIEPQRTRPVAPTAAAQAALDPALRYGLVLASLSGLAAELAALEGAAIDTLAVTAALAEDLGGADALFDGAAAGPILLGACGPCALDANTPRAGIASALTSFIRSPEDGTGLDVDDVREFVEGMRTNVEPELFPADQPPIAFDVTPPTVRILAPSVDAVVDGTVDLEVTALDENELASIVVTGSGPFVAPADDDPTAERYFANWDTTLVPDQLVTITAVATDAVGNRASVTVEVEVNNLGAGTIFGRCVKGPVEGAAARVFAFEDGAKGELVGEGLTDVAGGFRVEAGVTYNGPVLVECGGDGASYLEEAFDATVGFAAADQLRVVLLDFVDGENHGPIVATPFSSFVVALVEWLMETQPTLTLTAAHATALARVATLLDLADLVGTIPAPLDGSVSADGDDARYAVALAGLSQLAVALAERGGVLPGADASALVLWRRLEEDVRADGCWDGRGRAGDLLTIAGEILGDDALRLQLADAVATWVDGPFDTTGSYSVADFRDLVEHLSALGPLSGAAGDPTVCEPGSVFPDAGEAFDRTPPLVAFADPTPADGAVVRGTITVRASANDAWDSAPVVTLAEPAGLVDDDSGPAGVASMIDTLVVGDGALGLRVAAVDLDGNAAEAERALVVDNTAPVLALTAPVDGAWVNADVALSATVTDANPDVVVATLDGVGVTLPTTVSVEGAHTVTAYAQDLAGNVSPTVTRAFTLDKGAPSITVTPASGGYARTTVTYTAVIDDALKGIGSLDGTVPTTLAVAVAGAGSPVVVPTHSTLPDGRVQLVAVVATTAANDGALTFTFTGRDRAGNVAASGTRTVTVDNTAPAVTVSGGGTWGNSTNPTYTGTVSDATPGVGVTVTVGAGTQSATVVGAIWSVAWSAPLMDGQHAVSADATDAVGNTRRATATIGVDTAPPTITAVPNPIITDELTLALSFSVNAEPIYGAGTPGSLVDAATVRKYQTRLTGSTLGANPIEWRFNVTDALPGSGVVLAAVTYTVRAPDGTSYGPFATTVPLTLTPSANRAALVTTTQVPGVGTALSKLETEDGTWRVEVSATDGGGGIRTVAYTWNHVPLGEPVEIVQILDEPPIPVAHAYSIETHRLESPTNRFAPLIAGTATTGRGLLRYLVRNGTTRDVYVGFFVPRTSASATYTGQKVARGPAAGATPVRCPYPDRWRINTDGTATCEGAGWTFPVHADLPISGTFGNINDLIGGVELFNGVSAVAVTGGGALTLTVGGIVYVYREYLVPAASMPGMSGGATLRYAVVPVDGLPEWTPLSSGTPVDRSLSTSAGVRSITGEVYEDYGVCTNYNVMTDTCIAAERRRYYKALSWGRLTIANLRAAVGTRPALSTVIVEHDLYNSALGTGSPLNQASMTFETCEGTFVAPGGACTSSLP